MSVMKNRLKNVSLIKEKWSKNGVQIFSIQILLKDCLFFFPTDKQINVSY